MAEPLTEDQLIEAYGGETIAAMVDAREVARILGVHTNTVKRIPSWELSYTRINRRGDRRYLRSDIIAFVAQRRVG